MNFPWWREGQVGAPACWWNRPQQGSVGSRCSCVLKTLGGLVALGPWGTPRSGWGLGAVQTSDSPTGIPGQHRQDSGAAGLRGLNHAWLLALPSKQPCSPRPAVPGPPASAPSLCTPSAFLHLGLGLHLCVGCVHCPGIYPLIQPTIHLSICPSIPSSYKYSP